MNYDEAKRRLLSPHRGIDDQDYRKEEIARNVIMLSFAENMERIANALTKIADAPRQSSLEELTRKINRSV